MKLHYRPIKVGKEMEVPFRDLNGIFDFFEQNPNFKRRDALSCYLSSYSETLLLSISTKKKLKNNRSAIYVVEFTDTFHRIEWIHEILSRIDLESIHEIKFMRQEIETQKALLVQGVKEEHELRSVLQVQIFNEHERDKKFDMIINHLGKLPEDKNDPEEKNLKVISKRLNKKNPEKHFNTFINTPSSKINILHDSNILTKASIRKRNSQKDINRRLDIFRSSRDYFIPVTCLDSAYDQILLWCHQERVYLLTEEIRDELFERLIEKYSELKDWITAHEFSSNDREEILDEINILDLKSYISHAMFIANKTKRSKEVKNRKKKRQKALAIWNKYYVENVTSRERKKAGVNQRKVANQIDVSVGTLNAWFKEFKSSTK